MIWLRSITLALCALAICGMTANLPAAQEGKDGKDVTFTTADRVELKGKFYAGKDGRNSAAILLVHALGEDSTKAEWVALAKDLNKKGYAVLAFDLRGHGDSTKVQPGMYNIQPALRVRGFWDEVENYKYYNGFNPNPQVPRKEEIDAKFFKPGYHKVMVNDIAAAKAFLDEKNDSGECNSGNLIVVAAKEGAALAAIWMNSEWHRYKYVPPPAGSPMGMAGSLDLQNPEGAGIAGAVFLSATDKLPVPTISLPNTLYTAAFTKKTPIAFFYSAEDKKAENIANKCEAKLKDKTKNPLLVKVPIPGAKAAEGRQLLVPSLGTAPAIVEYIEKVLADRPGQAKQRVDKDDSFMWQWQNSNGSIGKLNSRRGYKAAYSNYDPFIRYGQ